MKVLVIKTSSMGDVIHTFPALTDAMHAIPGVSFDWLVEEPYMGIVALHPAVNRAIPIALRRWKKHPLRLGYWRELFALLGSLGNTRYDRIIDAQGLLKSALPAVFARGIRTGYARNSIREPIASLFYRKKYEVDRDLHAVTRIRSLFEQSLGYRYERNALEYGLPVTKSDGKDRPYAVFIHGSSWPSKQWPREYWGEAVRLAAAENIEVMFPWGSAQEKQQAEQICTEAGAGRILPALSLKELAEVIGGAAMMIGVDTGLSHLAAALAVPGVVIYGSTASNLTGVVGKRQDSVQMQFHCAPCMKRECALPFEQDRRPCYMTLTPEYIWNAAKKHVDRAVFAQ
jgi:heptosyltransferase-1